MMKNKILRAIVSIMLVCILIFNITPLRANAMTGIIEGSVVTGNPYIIIGAVIIALGIQVANEAGVFENLTNSAVSALDTAGGWIKDGAMELIKTVDETGRATYYASGELFEAVRSWAFESGIVAVTETRLDESALFQEALTAAMEYPYWVITLSSAASDTYTCWGSESPFTWGYEGEQLKLYVGTTEAYSFYYSSGYVKSVYRKAGSTWSVHSVNTSSVTTSVTTSYDLELGNVPASYIDGTSALAWAPEYANRQLRVIEGGGDQSGDTGDQKWKWYLPISLAATLAGVAASNQQVQHSGVTPSDFEETTTIRDLDIIATPEVDGFQGIEIEPSTGTTPDVVPGTIGLSDIWAMIKSIPGSLADVITGPIVGTLTDIWDFIKTIPDTLADVITGPIVGTLTDIWDFIKTIPDTLAEVITGPIVGALTNIWDLITSIPQAIAEAISAIFIPSEDFLSAKWEAIRSEFTFADSIITSGQSILDIFRGVDPEPPVIYINLGDSESSYNLGGQVAFLDLRWYERYKSTGDAIISAFLWLAFAWRMFLKLPGIISGLPGDFVMHSVVDLGLSDHLPARKKEYELQRQENRRSIKK